MAESYKEYLPDGATDTFAITFPYIDKTHVHVYIDGVEDTTFSWASVATIQTTDMPGSGSTVIIRRETPSDARMVDFSNTSMLDEATLDRDSQQNFFKLQEISDTDGDKLIYDGLVGGYDAQSRTIKNVAAPTDAKDAVNKEYFEGTFEPQLNAIVADAEAAQGLAEAAQGLAEVAQVLAEDAQFEAESAEATATVKADVATTKASDANASANEALTYKNTAALWAEEDEDVEVTSGKYSAKHWATKAADTVVKGIRVRSDLEVVTAGAAFMVPGDEIANESIYLNGVLLQPDDDYSIDGTTVTLVKTAQVGSVLTVISTYPVVLANVVNKDGDTMTGPLILDDDPTDELGAATKQYADTGNNIIINPTFLINQAVVAAGSHAAGVYFRDQWKAGAAGCVVSITGGVLTISSGSVVQPVEDLNVLSGEFTVTWEGTSHLWHGGTQRSSPYTFTASGMGETFTWDPGTLSKPMMVAGVAPAAYRPTDFGEDLRRCQRYYTKTYSYTVAPGTNNQEEGSIQLMCGDDNMSELPHTVRYPVEMRATPTLTLYDPAGGSANYILDDAMTEVVATIRGSSPSGYGGVNIAGMSSTGNLVRWHHVAKAQL